MGGLRTYIGLLGLVAILGSQAVWLPSDPQIRSRDAMTATDNGGIRLPLISPHVQPSIRLLPPTWREDSLQKIALPSFEERPISHVRLGDGDYLVADWRDSRLHYRLNGVNPWGEHPSGDSSARRPRSSL
jgi:hypothetical protein